MTVEEMVDGLLKIKVPNAYAKRERSCEHYSREDEHDWIYEGTADDGTSFYHCRCCGKAVED